jgi:hypothetical protein
MLSFVKKNRSKRNRTSILNQRGGAKKEFLMFGLMGCACGRFVVEMRRCK